MGESLLLPHSTHCISAPCNNYHLIYEQFYSANSYLKKKMAPYKSTIKN